MGCHRLPETFHGKEGVVVALALPSEIHSRAGPRGSRPHRALFATWATAHPALIPHEAPGNPRPHPRIPATIRAQSPAVAANPRRSPLSPEAPRPACHAGGRGFESRRSRSSFRLQARLFGETRKMLRGLGDVPRRQNVALGN